MLKRFFVLTLLLSVSLLGSTMLVGCGQKGPLYLPIESSPTQADEEEKPVKDTQGDEATTD